MVDDVEDPANLSGLDDEFKHRLGNNEWSKIKRIACAPVQQCILIHITLYPQIVAGLHLSPVPTAHKSYVKSTCCEEIDLINEKLSEVARDTEYPRPPRVFGVCLNLWMLQTSACICK